MHKGVRTAMLVAACAFLGSAVFAADGGRNTIRLGVSRFEPTGDSEGRLVTGFSSSPPVALEGDSDTGFELSFEHRLSDAVGLEVALARYEPDFGLTARSLDLGTAVTLAGDARVMPLSVALNLHLLRRGNVDLYAGPVLAYVTYGSPVYQIGAQRLEVELEDELSLGAQAGIDYAVAANWGLSFRVKYLRMRGEVDTLVSYFPEMDEPNKAAAFRVMAAHATEDFKLNPVTATLAASYRF